MSEVELPADAESGRHAESNLAQRAADVIEKQFAGVDIEDPD